MIPIAKKNENRGGGDFAAPPFIKWPGGKRALLSSILPLFPQAPKRYFEPFLGGGAVFFALQPRKAILSDLNEELINLYQCVRDDPVGLIRILKTLKNSEGHYYKIRAKRCRSPLRRAARILYLNTLSFNGIHRVNLNGEFNVPYGYKTHLATCDEDGLLVASLALQGAKIVATDFESATEDAGIGDVVYFDPPYTVAHAHNGFVKYNERIFSWDDQCRLARHAHELARKGCRVVVSNADHPTIRGLYKDFRFAVVERFSRIAASKKHRAQIQEVVYYNVGE